MNKIETYKRFVKAYSFIFAPSAQRIIEIFKVSDQPLMVSTVTAFLRQQGKEIEVGTVSANIAKIRKAGIVYLTEKPEGFKPKGAGIITHYALNRQFIESLEPALAIFSAIRALACPRSWAIVKHFCDMPKSFECTPTEAAINLRAAADVQFSTESPNMHLDFPRLAKSGILIKLPKRGATAPYKLNYEFLENLNQIIHAIKTK